MSNATRWRTQETRKRQIEIFSAGCPVCDDLISAVRSLACPSCEIGVLDMHETAVAARAAQLGVRSVPAVAVDGILADCCQESGPDIAALRAAGLGQPLD